MITEDEKKAVWLAAHAAALRLHGGKPEDAVKAANDAVDAFVAKMATTKETEPA
jgi:hypothetical protein